MRCDWYISVGMLLLASMPQQPTIRAQPQAPDNSIVAVRTVMVDGLKLQYLAAGHGPAVVLLHGYAETSRMWRPLMPRLAEHFTVIAPDLPGIGESDIPKDGVNMTRAAARIHDLVKSIGIEKAAVVGHDIGLMVAYAYAAQFPAETEKLVLMDAFLPGVDGWEAVYNNPRLWHFRFHGPTPEALVAGHERTYLDYYWNDFAADWTRSLPETDRRAYAAAYARPGRMRAAWAYFDSFQQAAKDFARFSETALTMPVLSIGGAKANGDALGRQAKAYRGERNRDDLAQHGALADGRATTRDGRRVGRLSQRAAQSDTRVHGAEPTAHDTGRDSCETDRFGADRQFRVARCHHADSYRRSVTHRLLHDRVVGAGAHDDSRAFAP